MVCITCYNFVSGHFTLNVNGFGKPMVGSVECMREASQCIMGVPDSRVTNWLPHMYYKCISLFCILKVLFFNELFFQSHFMDISEPSAL